MEDKLIGNQKLQNVLFRQDLKKNLGHAYLFVGPSGTGKTTMAKHWIKFILCEDDQHDRACGKCLTCQQFDRGLYTDFVKVERLEGKKNISIEQIRDLQSNLSLSSMSKNYKVVLIKEIESFNEESFNSFLKTLEEPTSRTILVMTADSINNVPLTILSRCSVLKLNSVAQKEMKPWLDGLCPLTADLNKIIMWANGRPGLAKKLTEDQDLYQWYDEQTKTCLKILQAKKVSLKWSIIDDWFKHLPKNFNEKTDRVLSSLNVYQIIIRQILKKKFDEPSRDSLYLFAQSFSVIELVHYLEGLNNAKSMIKRNLNQQLVLENLFN